VGGPVGIQKEIFEDFFKKLKDAKLPDEVIEKLRTLWERDELGSKEKILEALKTGIKNANKH
jgi:uncharacterized secreted protein with C-terminal beta-propeller domain